MYYAFLKQVQTATAVAGVVSNDTIERTREGAAHHDKAAYAFRKLTRQSLGGGSGAGSAPAPPAGATASVLDGVDAVNSAVTACTTSDADTGARKSTRGGGDSAPVNETARAAGGGTHTNLQMEGPKQNVLQAVRFRDLNELLPKAIARCRGQVLEPA